MKSELVVQMDCSSAAVRGTVNQHLVKAATTAEVEAIIVRLKSCKVLRTAQLQHADLLSMY